MIHKFISNDNKGNVNTLEIGSDYTKISKVVDPVNSDDAVNKRYVDQAGSSLPSVTSSDNGKVLAVEDGAWAASEQGKKFIVTLTPTSPDYSGTMDKTVAQINEAYEAGMEIVFKLQTDASSYIEVPVQLVGHNTTFTYPSFETSVVQSAGNVQVFAYTGVTGDGTKQTYSTTVYSLTTVS